MKTTIWIDDDEGGSIPAIVEIRQEGEYITLANKDIHIRIKADAVLTAMGDEGHG